VNAARKQLLTGACLADEQNRNAATRGYLSRKCDYFADGRALPDYMGVPAVRGRELRSG
jgi:hypothetical protein